MGSTQSQYGVAGAAWLAHNCTDAADGGTVIADDTASCPGGSAAVKAAVLSVWTSSCPVSTSGTPPPPPPPPPTPTYHKLTSQVTYDIDLTAIADGSDARSNFEAEFKADVAAAMGGAYTADDVTINSIVSGSVVVDFSVTVLSSAVTAATATFNTNIVSTPTALDNTAASAAASAITAPVAAPVPVAAASGTAGPVVKSSAKAAASLS